MIEDLVSHDIFADNLLLGKSLMFSLRLSPDWHLAPGVGRPEVAATHDRMGKKWVVTGDAWYVVYHNQRKWAVEMAAHIRPVPENEPPSTGKTISINQHPGYVSWRSKKRGLPWNRHMVTFMEVVFNCPYSERQIKFEVSGWCPQEGFEEVLQSLQHTGCH